MYVEVAFKSPVAGPGYEKDLDLSLGSVTGLGLQTHPV